MTLLGRFDRYWFAPAPAVRLALLRILCGSYALVYLLAGFPTLTTVRHFDRHEFTPAGIVSLLSAPLPGGLVLGVTLLTAVLALVFVLGYRYAWSAPVFALSFLWVTSYRNSWGMLFHTENLLTLHVLILGFSPAADALSLDARGRAEPADSGAYGWAGRAMAWVIAVCYVLAGIAKLKLAGPLWLEGALLRAQIAYDNLRKIELGSNYSALGAWLVQYRWPFRVFAWLTLVVELGAPLALLGGRVALAWVASAWLFHLGVLTLMAIPFHYQLSLVAYAPLFPVERLAARGFNRFGSPPLTRFFARFLAPAVPRDESAE
jgi:hypothetical protein